MSILLPRPPVVKPRKPLLPVPIDYRWATPVIWPCIILRHGAPGMLLIHETPYLVTPSGEYDPDRGAIIHGWRLSKSDGTHHDIDPMSWSCDCGDAVWRPERPGGCKHAANLKAALAGRGRVLERPEPTEEQLLDYKPAGHSHGIPF